MIRSLSLVWISPKGQRKEASLWNAMQIKCDDCLRAIGFIMKCSEEMNFGTVQNLKWNVWGKGQK